MGFNLERIKALDIWKSEVDIEPVKGGITNQNYIVADRGKKYFVRIGVDMPEHGIKRFNELAASSAASAIGLSPKVIYAEPGIMVLQYIDADSLTEQSVREPDHLIEIVDLIKRCHQDIPGVIRGPTLVFWVFQVLRNYSLTLQEGKSDWLPCLEKLESIAQQLEADVGEIELKFGHNDLLAANFLNDGHRIWLIDWDYAGFNTPLFDLSGLASNNNFSFDEEILLLQHYYRSAPDLRMMKKYSAMKCASLLREAMWSMTSEIYSNIDFDYTAYARDNLALFHKAWDIHQTRYR